VKVNPTLQTPTPQHTDKMAKSSRASTNKANNQRLKKNVFGPVEAARAERLSARLMALAAEPKPVKDVEMNEGEFSYELTGKCDTDILLQSPQRNPKMLLRRLTVSHVMRRENPRAAN
jgi:hypothetical protein